MARQILLKNGTLLLHDENDNVVPRKADLLIQGTEIAQIEDAIEPSPCMEIIDCSSALVSPGFINTHHHLWQTQLKGIHANHNLLDYFHTGSFPSAFFTPRDIFWGQLAGALESIDAGTTTVVDHANMNHSQQHTGEAIRATVASRIRSIFCYCPTPRVAQWEPTFTLEKDMIPDWVMDGFHKFCALQPIGTDARVKLGFAFDGTFLPAEVLRQLFKDVRVAGAHLITFHAVHGAMFHKSKRPSMVKKLGDNQLLDQAFLLSHANNLSTEELDVIKKSGAHISSTPSTELQMGHGDPVCLEDSCYSFASLGVDCHSSCTSSMPSQMAMVLQWHRAVRHAKFEANGMWADSVQRTVQDVYNLGTILGARAVRMDNEIGSISVGKKADIVIFDGSSPSMLSAAKRDPVAAIVLHSSIRDVNTVIIGGTVCKRDGILKDVFVPREVGGERQEEGDVLKWEQIVQAVDQSRERIDAEVSRRVDPDIAREGVIEGFHLDKATLCSTC